MSDMPGYRAAQAAYDNMTPPDDGPTPCPECDGKGEIPDYTDPESPWFVCPRCDGLLWIDENGEPYDKHEAERAADEAADMKRDERNLG